MTTPVWFLYHKFNWAMCLCIRIFVFQFQLRFVFKILIRKSARALVCLTLLTILKFLEASVFSLFHAGSEFNEFIILPIPVSILKKREIIILNMIVI